MSLNQRLAEIKSRIDHGELLPIEVFTMMIEAFHVKGWLSDNSYKENSFIGFDIKNKCEFQNTEIFINRRSGDITLPGELIDEFKGE